MALERPKNNLLKNLLLAILSIGFFSAVYFFTFYFFSHQKVDQPVTSRITENIPTPEKTSVGRLPRSVNMVTEVKTAIATILGSTVDAPSVENSPVASTPSGASANKQPVASTSSPSAGNQPVSTKPNQPDAPMAGSEGGVSNTGSQTTITKAEDIPFPDGSSSIISSNQPEDNNPPINNSSSASTVDPSLSFGSFYDTFSNEAGVDLNKTDLYQDNNATAIFFPPNYVWQPATDNIISSLKNYVEAVSINDFKGPYNDRRCLGDNCLEQNNNDLYYNGQRLFLPDGLRSTDIQAVSFSIVGQKWLVGFTLKNGTKYEGKVFYLDPSSGAPKFFALSLPEISSPYPGLFGFGGEENDFLVVYGAYKGVAYRVRGDRFTDISQFFDIRIMNGGFKPEIFKTFYQDNINWYIFSSSKGNARLIKLWQNQTPEIVGEASYKDLFEFGTESGIFRPFEVKADKISILAKVRKNGLDSWKVFTDRGFNNGQPGTLTFKAVGRGDGASISFKKIADSRLGIDEVSRNYVKLWFSSDGTNYQVVPGGNNIDFQTSAIKNFFLKVTIDASPSQFYSPFLNDVLFDYYFRK